MARLITIHPKTPPLDARLRGHDEDGRVRCHSRESGNPAIGRKRSFWTAWHISMAVFACVIAVPALAHAHGGMSGQEIAPPIVTSGVLGFACYWLVMLWPSSKKKGNPEVGFNGQNRGAPRVKRKPRLRKIEGSSQIGGSVNSGRKATYG